MRTLPRRPNENKGETGVFKNAEPQNMVHAACLRAYECMGRKPKSPSWHEVRGYVVAL